MKMNVEGFNCEYDFVPYESFDECQLPWGSTVNAHGIQYTEFGKSMLGAINFFRKGAVQITEKDLSKLFIAEENEISKFVKDNLSRIKLIKRDEYKQTSEGYLGMHTKESRLKTRTPYEFTDVILYIKYSVRTRTFSIVFNRSALNINIPEQEHIAKKYFDILLMDYWNYDMYAWSIFNEKGLLDKFEFIPLVIEDCYKCSVSHKAYRDSYGFVPEVDYPTRGINILEDEKEMEALKDWLAQGGKINKYNMYYILASREDRSKHYLRRLKQIGND